MAANEWSEKKKMIVTVAVGAGVNLLLGTLLYFGYKKAGECEVSLTSERDKLAKLKKEVEAKEPLEREFSTLTLDFNEKAKKLPPSEELDRLIDGISGIAAKNNCDLNKSSRSTTASRTGGAGTQGPSGGAILVPDTWQTEWQADFHGWCKLMNELEEHYERFIAFEGLTITPKLSGMTDKNTKHDIKVNIVTYQYVKK